MRARSDSVFTSLAAEAVLLAGGGRAILLQIADAEVGYGVAAHSDFANRPLERLANTVTYAYATVFASPEELARVVSRVNHAHAPVVSSPHEHDEYHRASNADEREADGGERGVGGHPTVHYNAFDRRAQLWVAATLYQTALTVYEKTFGPLEPDDAEEVYQRYGVLGSALQMPAELWPADRAAFREYWNTAVADLRVTDPARRVAHDLLHPRTAPLWLRAVMPVVRLVTTGLLSPELRRAFVLPWSTGSQRRFDRLFRVLAVVYPRLPLAVRRLPRDRYMRALRASLQD
ncbi:oxygenase MpaB family protein [Subtercola boreus]|uniref:ER-bound oxygenase mpaB/mpaB'/Rubber oxygenase catalytic domain-containing protein n=1 Tax=Subtercola boreus TaxID=120213 RepID=A0A3E0WA74_9MICO|nr:oxygenase MpaB family protein [Subtercola boreus]RFA19383.1 hypothetical protein B7R24_12120 [Subtercola boreus]RFA19644.1 hypothetical protein B7R23_12100 [Subtercola boreus]RFA26009.1 hypothetical protein B7R25_12220 [Subtercola boreus]